MCDVPRKAGSQEELMETSGEELLSRKKQKVEATRWSGNQRPILNGFDLLIVLCSSY